MSVTWGRIFLRCYIPSLFKWNIFSKASQSFHILPNMCACLEVLPTCSSSLKRFCMSLWQSQPYLDNATQILNVGSLCVQYLLHHPVHIRLGSLHLSSLFTCLWAQFRLWMFCHSLSTALSSLSPPHVHPSIISFIFLPASQLPGWHQFQPYRPRVLVWGPWVTVRCSNKGGAAAQRAVTVPGRSRGRGRAVADRPFGAVWWGVHAEGGAVAQGGVVEGRVAEAAGWYVSGAQDRARVRDFR